MHKKLKFKDPGIASRIFLFCGPAQIGLFLILLRGGIPPDPQAGSRAERKWFRWFSRKLVLFAAIAG